MGGAVDSESDTFAWLVHPLDPGEFEREYYEKKVCVVNRATGSYHQDLLCLADLDRVLGTHLIRHPDLNIVQVDRTLAATDYADREGIVDPVRAARLYAEGATMIFSQLHSRLPALARLCTTLSRLFSSRLQTNIYLT